MKVYVDRDELVEMLYNAVGGSREKIKEIVNGAIIHQVSDSSYEIGYSDGREAQSIFYASEKEAIKHAIDEIEFIFCNNIMSTCETVLYCDRRRIINSIAIIKNLCEVKRGKE